MEKDCEFNGENKRFYLQLIQDVIKRMSSNSFLVKGWSLTILGGLITLYTYNISKPWSKKLLILCLALIFSFWFLNAYFLMMERSYRNLYNYAIMLRENKINFSLDYKKFKSPFSKSLFGPTILITYSTITILVIYLLFNK